MVAMGLYSNIYTHVSEYVDRLALRLTMDRVRGGEMLRVQTAANVQQPWCMMKKMSVAVILFAVPLLYVSLLHATPSQLVKDSAFWFIISNSIILILAAESGTLSSSSSSGCAAGDGATSALADLAAPRYTQPAVTVPPATQEVLDASGAESTTSSELPPTAPGRKRKVRRSKSSVAKSGGSKGASKVIRRSATAKEMAVVGATAEEGAEQDNKYAELSLEQLNRRVEEFIRGFNRKMMLEIENEGINTAPYSPAQALNCW